MSGRDKAYFLSDLHLGAPYFPDSKDSEKRVVAFLDSIKEDAKEIYLVGDILDYWYEYRYVVPKGFVRFFGKLAELSDSGIKITWMIGNHDIWSFGYLASELGIEVIDGSLRINILGKDFEIAHGDGIGGNRKFRMLRRLFRNKVCQKMYGGIHPRWTVAFAQRWSRSSRESGSSENTIASRHLEAIRQHCMDLISREPEINYFVYGHLHIVCDEKLDEHARLIVLGDWITNFSYGVFDGHTFDIHYFKSDKLGE